MSLMTTDIGVLNKLISRSYLQMLEMRGVSEFDFNEAHPRLHFVRVHGLADFWSDGDEIGAFVQAGQNVLHALHASGATVCSLVACEERQIKMYLGVSPSLVAGLEQTLLGYFPQIELEAAGEPDVRLDRFGYGGIITGIPAVKEVAGQDGIQQIEQICRGMMTDNWLIMIIAKPVSAAETSAALTRINDELDAVSGRIKQTRSESALSGKYVTASVEYTDSNARLYVDRVTGLQTSLSDGAQCGMWQYTGYYAAVQPEAAIRLAALVKAGYTGELSRPEVVRCIPVRNINRYVVSYSTIDDVFDGCEEYPAGRWSDAAGEHEMYAGKYTTVLNSQQLGVLLRLPRAEFPGYFVNRHVAFDTAKRRARQSDGDGFFTLGRIVDMNMRTHAAAAGRYELPLDDLMRHALIIGITGGGKTNTAKAILSTLWTTHNVPFLVIESAKREYWELMNVAGFDRLKVFTLGLEDAGHSVPYRLNPFEAGRFSSLQTHIDYLLSAFRASFEMHAPMPYLLESAVYEIYEDRGWDVIENRNKLGLREYPTLTDLYHKVDVVIERLGYDSEIKANVRAALKARIHSLRIGGKGAMLDTSRSIPMEELLNSPVVLELEELGDDETKAFVIGMLLVQLYEYRKGGELGGPQSLKHVLLVEEAHRLLKRVDASSESGSVRAKSVEFFCNLLAEIRSYGQGILIADQIPTKLAADTIKNTNLKIVHRTVMQEDREAVGFAMNMTRPQIEYLSSLRRGYAAVYAEGDNRPKLVLMPLLQPRADRRLNRSQVLDTVRSRLASDKFSYAPQETNGEKCELCGSNCRARPAIVRESRQFDLDGIVDDLRQSGYDAAALSVLIAMIESKLSRSFTISERLCWTAFLLARVQPDKEAIRAFILQYHTKMMSGRGT